MKTLEFVYKMDNGKSVEMRMKSAYEIKDCEEGKIVHLFLKNGEEYQGIFKGMDGDDIMLKSLKGISCIGIDIKFVKQYLEEI
jgi:hypothetical protein